MQLIKIESNTIGQEVKETVNARELHAFLEVKTAFKDWISRRVEDFDFIDGLDFCSFLSESGGRPSREYALTLDMAKELSMVERNEKGKQARQYFIECERRAKDPIAALNDPATMRTLLLSYSEQVLQRDKLIAHIHPKAAALDRIASADGWFSLRNAAKALKIKEHEFIKWLQVHGWIFRNKKGRLEGYSTKVPRHLDHKVTPIPTDGDSDRVSLQVMVTAEGLARLAQIFNTEIDVQAAA